MPNVYDSIGEDGSVGKNNFKTKNHFKIKNQNILFSLNIKNIKIHSMTIKHQNLQVNSYNLRIPWKINIKINVDAISYTMNKIRKVQVDVQYNNVNLLLDII